MWFCSFIILKLSKCRGHYVEGERGVTGRSAINLHNKLDYGATIRTIYELEG